MSLVSFLSTKNKNGLGYASTAEDVSAGLDLNGQCYLVTGCNSGIGQETCRVLALRGASVYGAARTLKKARKACSEWGSSAHGVECELSNLKSVRACVSRLLQEGVRLDGIVCNAGIMALPQLTLQQGVELQFLTNHVGHFLLVQDLLPSLTEAGRVVVVSSGAHRAAPPGGIQFDNLAGEKNYRAWAFYGQSKLANLLFAKELARRFQGTRKLALAVHPGVIQTQLARNGNALLRIGYALANPIALKTIPQGAATQVYAAIHSDVTGANGEYLSSCNLAKCSAYAEDRDLAKRLWSETERLISLLG